MNEAASPNPTGAAPVQVELRGIRRSYEGGKVTALAGVDLQIRAGEFVAIAGPSGCGKTTLLNLLGALDEPDQGSVLFGGRTLRGAAQRARFRARTVGFIFQSYHLLPTLTALENVQIPMFEMPWNGAERTNRARVLLGEVGLDHRINHLPSQLSGGERQRVAAARSLANEPELLLADEPTGNLDSKSSAELLDLLEQLHAARGMTLVVVTHDAAVASRAGRMVHMQDGKILSNGNPDLPP